MDRLNGGRGECRVGSTITPKLDYRQVVGWEELRVEKITDHSLGGDSRVVMTLKLPNGQTLDTPNEGQFFLTESSELQARAQFEDIAEKVAKLKTDDDSDHDEALEAIQNDPLEVAVRSGWVAPAGKINGQSPEEFKILLCTGGPAVQIIGELDEHCQPERARIEHQDWGTPWTEYRLSGDEQDVLLEYCRQFYFGE